jgi:hypothetical protein
MGGGEEEEVGREWPEGELCACVRACVCVCVCVCE